MSCGDALKRTHAADWQTRFEAVHALNQYIPDVDVVRRLIELLDDADTAVVQAATEALVLSGGVVELSAVLRALADGDNSVGYAIRDQLVELEQQGEPIAARSRSLLNSEEESVRRGVAAVLEAIG